MEEQDNRNKYRKSKKMMDEEKFWSIISLINFKNGNESEETIELAVNTLSKMSVKDIKEFEETLSYKLYLLDTKEHARNIGEYSYTEENQTYFSADLFLYIRCVVSAEGHQSFELILKNPEKMIKNRTFEPLLSIAAYAYTKRMRKEFEYMPSFDYETFSNNEG